MLALLPGVTYAARGSIADPGQIGKTKAMLRRAFEDQLAGGGFSIVEILSTCPVGWGMTAARTRWPTSRTTSSGPTRSACSSTGRAPRGRRR